MEEANVVANGEGVIRALDSDLVPKSQSLRRLGLHITFEGCSVKFPEFPISRNFNDNP